MMTQQYTFIALRIVLLIYGILIVLLELFILIRRIVDFFLKFRTICIAILKTVSLYEL